mgnify:CR=1 FL=1
MRVAVVVAVAAASCPEILSVNPGDDYSAHANPFEGVVPGEVFASTFFLEVVNSISYAWHKNYTVWIGTNRSRWQKLIKPYCANVSLDCATFVHEPSLDVVDFAYNSNPLAERCKREGWCDKYNEPLYRQWRTAGHRVVSQVHALNPRVRRALA